MHLLVVDDDAGLRALLRATFETFEVEIDEAESSARATALESWSLAGPMTWTSAAGNPASRKRFAIACAPGEVLPSLYDVLISMSCWKIARASAWSGVSVDCAAIESGARSAKASASDRRGIVGSGVGGTLRTTNLATRTAVRQRWPARFPSPPPHPPFCTILGCPDCPTTSSMYAYRNASPFTRPYRP